MFVPVLVWSGTAILVQRVARPRLEFQDRDLYNFSANTETEKV